MYSLYTDTFNIDRINNKIDILFQLPTEISSSGTYTDIQLISCYISIPLIQKRDKFVTYQLDCSELDDDLDLGKTLAYFTMKNNSVYRQRFPLIKSCTVNNYSTLHMSLIPNVKLPEKITNEDCDINIIIGIDLF